MTDTTCETSSQEGALRILIIDDEPTILFAVSDYFTMQGYAVDAAPDRQTAEAILAVNAYDLVIVDLRLSGSRSSDGLEIIRSVRARLETPVVLLTSCTSPELRDAAEAAGATAVLCKSMGLKSVSRMVSALIATCEAQ